MQPPSFSEGYLRFPDFVFRKEEEAAAQNKARKTGPRELKVELEEASFTQEKLALFLQYQRTVRRNAH